MGDVGLKREWLTPRFKIEATYSTERSGRVAVQVTIEGEGQALIDGRWVKARVAVDLQRNAQDLDDITEWTAGEFRP